jgi:hypothetical protein
MQTITIEMSEEDMKCLEEIKALSGLTSDVDAIKASLRYRRTILRGTREGLAVVVSRPDKDNEIAAILKSIRKPLKGGDYTTLNRQDLPRSKVTLPSLKGFDAVEVIKLDLHSKKLSHVKRKGSGQLSSAYLSVPLAKKFGMGDLE